MIEMLMNLIIFLPMVGAIAQLFITVRKSDRLQSVPVLFGVFSGLGALALGVHSIGLGAPVYATVFWIERFFLKYEIGLDGTNLAALLLCGTVFPVILFYDRIKKQSNSYDRSIILLLQTAVHGMVFSQNLFLSFLFWSSTLLPFWFLFGRGLVINSAKLSFRFLVSGVSGVVLVLFAITTVYIFFETNALSFLSTSHIEKPGAWFVFLEHEVSAQTVAFFLFSAGVFSRMFLYPGLFWITDLSREIRPISYILYAAVFIPISLYFYIKTTLVLFPQKLVQYSDLLTAFGIFNMLLASAFSFFQSDTIRILIQITVFQTGLVLVGLCSGGITGTEGALLHGLSFGLGTAGLGLLVSILGKDQYTDRAKFFGLLTKAPLFGVLLTVFLFQEIGVPGFSQFVSQTLVFFGAFGKSTIFGLLVGLSVVLLIYSIFRYFGDVYFSRQLEKVEVLEELTFRERLVFLPLVTVIGMMGIFPHIVAEVVRSAVGILLNKG